MSKTHTKTKTSSIISETTHKKLSELQFQLYKYIPLSNYRKYTIIPTPRRNTRRIKSKASIFTRIAARVILLSLNSKCSYIEIRQQYFLYRKYLRQYINYIINLIPVEFCIIIQNNKNVIRDFKHYYNTNIIHNINIILYNLEHSLSRLSHLSNSIDNSLEHRLENLIKLIKTPFTKLITKINNTKLIKFIKENNLQSFISGFTLIITIPCIAMIIAANSNIKNAPPVKSQNIQTPITTDEQEAGVISSVDEAQIWSNRRMQIIIDEYAYYDKLKCINEDLLDLMLHKYPEYHIRSIKAGDETHSTAQYSVYMDNLAYEWVMDSDHVKSTTNKIAHDIWAIWDKYQINVDKNIVVMLESQSNKDYVWYWCEKLYRIEEKK